VLTALWTEPITEPEELLLIDAVQNGHGRSLYNLVLDRHTAIAPNVHTKGRWKTAPTGIQDRDGGISLLPGMLPVGPVNADQ
jgi:hypothetical protein